MQCAGREGYQRDEEREACVCGNPEMVVWEEAGVQASFDRCGVDAAVFRKGMIAEDQGCEERDEGEPCRVAERETAAPSVRERV